MLLKLLILCLKSMLNLISCADSATTLLTVFSANKDFLQKFGKPLDKGASTAHSLKENSISDFHNF